MSRQNVFIIEPHVDDAFLSMGGHIEKWVKEGHRVNIVSVFSGTRKRAQDAQAYAHAVSATPILLGLMEGRADVSTVLAQLPPIPRDAQHSIYVPISLTHEEHQIVRDAAELAYTAEWCDYYLDMPYAVIQKNSGIVTECIRSMRPTSFLKPGMRKWRHIPLFKDQAKFFHYNPAEKLSACFEMTLTEL